MRVRKRPVEHDAIRFAADGSNHRAVGTFLGSDGVVVWPNVVGHNDMPRIYVNTLHGQVEVEPGAYVLRGDRDCWPVDAEQFEATYEVLTEEGSKS